MGKAASISAACVVAPPWDPAGVGRLRERHAPTRQCGARRRFSCEPLSRSPSLPVLLSPIHSLFFSSSLSSSLLLSLSLSLFLWPVPPEARCETVQLSSSSRRDYTPPTVIRIKDALISLGTPAGEYLELSSACLLLSLIHI